MGQRPVREDRVSLYAEVTQRVISELEMGRLPWVQPWDSSACALDLPCNASSGRDYSGINILILWNAVVERGYATQRWLTYRQAMNLGGHIRKGEQGTTICYADRFTPKGEVERAANQDEEARTIAFLKRYTVFNIDQCDGLPDPVYAMLERPSGSEILAEAEDIIVGSHAKVRVGGDRAYYAPDSDVVQVPPPAAYPEPLDWYRTVFHEMGHWTGHVSRFNREQRGSFGGPDYAREELVAEMASAFVCAALNIAPTVRHSDYIGAWLTLWRGEHNSSNREVSIM